MFDERYASFGKNYALNFTQNNLCGIYKISHISGKSFMDFVKKINNHTFFLLLAGFFSISFNVSAGNIKTANLRNCSSMGHLDVKSYNGDDFDCFISSDKKKFDGDDVLSISAAANDKNKIRIEFISYYGDGASCKNIKRYTSTHVRSVMIQDKSKGCPGSSKDEFGLFGDYFVCTYNQKKPPTCPGTAPEVTRYMSLHASDSSGKFISADDNGDGDVNANSDSLGKKEKFAVITRNGNECIVDGDIVTIQTSDGYYFKAPSDGNLTATSSSIGSWEEFTVTNHTDQAGCAEDNDQLSFFSVNREKFITATSSGDANVSGSSLGYKQKFTVMYN